MASTLRIVLLLPSLLVVVWPIPGHAQERVYHANPADEDWSFLRDRSKRIDPWDPAKYVSLGRDDWFLSLSGEIRFRPEGFRIKATDTAAAIRDQYLLQRYLFGADVHFGTRTRLYTEIQSGIINGRIGPARPTDRNSVDLHQGFVQWRSSRSPESRFDVRVGRQELAIGSSRLISAAPGLNVKRSFDGLRIAIGVRSWAVESAAAELTDLQSGAFDDGPAHRIKFWGAAARRPSSWWNGSWTIYYLGLKNRDIQFAQGRGPDTRHTLALNLRGALRSLDFNYDGIVQIGTFRGNDARAWGISTETGVRPPAAPWRLRIGLRANAASGDRSPADPTMQSFNPLFPGASFAGPIGLFGPTNMIDVTPSVSMVPRQGLVIGIERPLYWRTSTGDGLYNTALQLLAPPNAGSGRHIGASAGILVSWQATRHVQLSGAVIRLVPGRFLDATFVRGGAGLYSATVTYRF